MSLINDMLKDLDREQRGDDPPLPTGLAEPKRDTSAGLRRYLLPGVALIAVAYALVVEWNLLGLMPEKTPAPTEIPQPIALNSKWLKHNATGDAPTSVGIEKPVIASASMDQVALSEATADAQNPVAEVSSTEQPAAAPVIPESAIPAFDAETTAPVTAAEAPVADTEAQGGAVQRLLTVAEQALMANRLTTPAGDNAYQLYKSVLVIDPANAAAHAGIESIRERYLAWMERAIAEHRTAAAQIYWQKAKSVGVDAATLASYQTTLAEAQVAATSTALPPSPESIVTLPEPTITPAALPDDGHMAARLRHDGLRREQDALRLLAQVPGAEQTAVALTDLYVERRAVTELRRLAERLKQQPAQHYVMAQLAVLDGRDQQALDTLAAAEYSGAAERQRVRLLAGLQQKAGQHAAAMELYAALVADSPDNVGDWLGLAVSADKSKLTSTALNAYEKVLLLRHPDQRVMQYARQRRQDLSIAAMNNR